MLALTGSLTIDGLCHVLLHACMILGLLIKTPCIDRKAFLNMKVCIVPKFDHLLIRCQVHSIRR